MTTDPGKAYREQLIHTGSMPDIFVTAYDRIVSLLNSAANSIVKRDIEAKTHSLNQALTIIVTLEGALDFERGGKVATNLARFYKLLRGEIFKGSIKLDPGILRQAAAHVSEIRRIWEQAQALDAGTAAAAAGETSSQGPTPRPISTTSENPVSFEGSSASWTA